MVATVAAAGSPPAKGWMEVYSLVCIEGYSVPDVAARLNLPPAKVRQACNQALTWLATNPPLLAERSKEEALKLSEAVARERLEYLYAEAMEAWKKSQEDEVIVRQEGLMARTTRTIRSSYGKICYLNIAAKISEALLKIPVRYVPAWMEEGEAASEPIRFELDAGERAARAGKSAEAKPKRAKRRPNPPEGDCSPSAPVTSADADSLQPSFDVMLHEFTSNANGLAAAQTQLQSRARLFTPVQTPDGEPNDEDGEQAEEAFDDAVDRVLEATPSVTVAPAKRPSLLPKQTGRPLTQKERRARQKLLEKAKKRSKAG